MKKIILALTALTLAMVSCHTSREVVSEPTGTGAVKMTTQEQYKALAASYRQWVDVQVPVSLSLKAPSKVSISGRATMVRDSEIYMSFKMLGFEVAQLYITSDSVYALEKVHKYYLAESISDVLRGADLTIADIQALMLGQVFEPGKGTIGDDARGLKVSIENSSLVLQPKRTPRGTDMTYTCATGTVPMLQSLDIAVDGHADVACSYSDHRWTQAGEAARVVDINAQAKGRDIVAQVRWDLGDAKWDTGRAIKFKRPSGYKRISASALLKTLSDM